MKICFKCNTEKPLTQYYKHKQMSDGYLGKCKQCTKNDTKKRVDILLNDPEWVEKEKSRHRDKYHRLEYREKHKPTPEMKKKAMDNYNKKYPEKRKVKSLCNNIKPVIKGNHLHHWSYKSIHARDVIELSVKNHNTAHRFLKYDQDTFMYKTLDGLLLNTKELHLKYINAVIEHDKLISEFNTQ